MSERISYWTGAESATLGLHFWAGAALYAVADNRVVCSVPPRGASVGQWRLPQRPIRHDYANGAAFVFQSLVNRLIQRRKAQAPPDLAAGSHCGLVRDSNEDNFLLIHLPGAEDAILAVADGLGGHEGGEIASYFALQALLSARLGYGADNSFHGVSAAKALLRDGLASANEHIHTINHRLGGGMRMGTTVVAGVFLRSRVVVAHAGDSRCYRWRNHRLDQLTRDHSWVEFMVQEGNITRDEANGHPLSHMLSNCVGTRPSTHVSLRVVPSRPGDRYMLCTDGVSAVLSDEAISECLADTRSAQEAVSLTIRKSLSHGGIDNISAAVAFL